MPYEQCTRSIECAVAHHSARQAPSVKDVLSQSPGTGRNPSSWPSLTKCKEPRPGPRRVLAHTEGLPHLEASLRPPWPPTWIWLKLVSPSHLETADECTYLGLLARTATPPPCYRGPIGDLSLKAVSRETLKNTVRTPKRPLFALNLHQKSSAKTTNFKA